MKLLTSRTLTEPRLAFHCTHVSQTSSCQQWEKCHRQRASHFYFTPYPPRSAATIRGQPRHGVSCGSALLMAQQSLFRDHSPSAVLQAQAPSCVALRSKATLYTWHGRGIILMVFQWLQIRCVLIVNQGNCSSDLITLLRRAGAQKSNQISSGSWVTKQGYFVAKDSLFSNFAEVSSFVLGHSSPCLCANSSRITGLSMHKPPHLGCLSYPSDKKLRYFRF